MRVANPEGTDVFLTRDHDRDLDGGQKAFLKQRLGRT